MPKVGDTAPSWRLSTAGGDRVEFPEQIEDGPVIVLFWTTWCPYCKALMPRLAGLADRLDRTLPVFAISFAEGNDAPPAVPDGLIHLPRGDAVADRYGVVMVPALFVVDRKGRIIYRLDYPPDDHPSQQTTDRGRQARLLAQWWEERLKKILVDT